MLNMIVSTRTNKVRISTEVKDKIVRIALEGSRRQREAARIYAHLKLIGYKIAKTYPEFWNVGYSANGTLHSNATFKNGSPIWRLCPKHVHCIALLAELDGDIHVLDVCNRAELASVERRLINR